MKDKNHIYMSSSENRNMQSNTTIVAQIAPKFCMEGGGFNMLNSNLHSELLSLQLQACQVQALSQTTCH